LSKRVFQLAKELGVNSKAIVEKCVAEGIPKITNHMSPVSAGLEASIRDWFTTHDSGEATTAIETAAPVDLDKVKVAPKRRARAIGSSSGAEAEEGTSTAVAEPPAGRSTTTAPASGDDETPEDQTETPTKPRASVAPPAPPAAARPTAPESPEEESEDAPPAREARKAVATPAAPARPAAKAPPAPAARPAQMNVPTRPTVIQPAGPQLQQTKPAQLSGPKVVRIEQPDVIDVPKSRRPQSSEGGISTGRGPRGGEGVGVRGPAAGPEDEASRSPRRNKRRAGPAGPTGGAGAGARRTGKAGEESGSWRSQDLIEREERLARAEGFLRQRRRDAKLKDKSAPHERSASLAQTGGEVRITKPFTIKDLSAGTGVKAADIVKKLFLKGIMTTANAAIEPELAQEILLDWNIDLIVEEAHSAEAEVAQLFVDRATVDERPRSPVVTIMGHVDHGKTSLLDKIRNANVAAGEAGGITQATSAFRVPVRMGDDEKQVCFLDTPGHRAFSEMRSRGANMTDIVVLVVAADDGVMPQTIESISHAKAAKVPVVVALNKIDLPNATQANITKIFGQLAEQGLNPAEWGGETEVVRTSAATGQGIPELLETLDYQAQLLDLKADFKGPAQGAVIESKLVEGRGPVANILVQQGELKVGDIVVAGRAYGRVRDITNDRGERLEKALPATPVQISGLDELPDAGDRFFIVKNLRQASDAAEQRRHREREKELAQPRVTLDSMFASLKDTETKELLVVLKADVQGSVDVIRKSVEEVSTDKVKIRVLQATVGGINESDVTLAAASGAIILGFNVIASGKARSLAEQKKVEIRPYQVIYHLIDDVKLAAEGLLAPTIRQEVLGHAEVRKVFKLTKHGAVAGCYVTDGTIERNAFIRVTRGDIVIENDRVLEQLKRFKDDAKEVRAGQECGMKIAGYDDIKEGDILECYRNVEVKQTL